MHKGALFSAHIKFSCNLQLCFTDIEIHCACFTPTEAISIHEKQVGTKGVGVNSASVTGIISSHFLMLSFLSSLYCWMHQIENCVHSLLHGIDFEVTPHASPSHCTRFGVSSDQDAVNNRNFSITVPLSPTIRRVNFIRIQLWIQVWTCHIGLAWWCNCLHNCLMSRL